MEIGYVLNHRYIEATSQNVILQYCGVAGENIVVRSTENFRPECWKSCVYTTMTHTVFISSLFTMPGMYRILKKTMDWPWHITPRGSGLLLGQKKKLDAQSEILQGMKLFQELLYKIRNKVFGLQLCSYNCSKIKSSRELVVLNKFGIHKFTAKNWITI
jgi:hypothetical protein